MEEIVLAASGLGRPDSTAASGSISRAGSGDKRKGGRPSPRAQTGTTPSGGGNRGNSKRARVNTDELAAATSSAGAAGHAGPNPADDDDYSEPEDADKAAVKTEVRISSKVDPKGKRRAGSAEKERVSPAEFGLASEPDASVKTEVLVSPPSKRKAAGGQLKHNQCAAYM